MSAATETKSLSDLKAIQEAILRLTPDEFRELVAWFDEREAAADRRFEAEVQSGKFDALAAKAMADFEAGRCTEL